MNGGDLNQQQQQQHQQWAAMHQYQQQQWMAMQYPAAAMAMQQQQMMYGQHHYMPYYQQQHQQVYQQPPKQNQMQQQSSSDEKRTIWIGDLEPWMDEAYLRSCFDTTGEVVSVKLIRNKQTGQSDRYGFIELNSSSAAENLLQNYNGTLMPNTDQNFRLNWASFSTGEKRASEASSDLSIFVGDLASDVTDALLHDTFASKYPSVKGAKVVIDSSIGRSKGYGFVRFGDESERTKAMNEMNGEYCSSRPMRIGVATPKKPLMQQQFGSQAVIVSGGFAQNGAAQSDNDSSNTTIFVGGLDSEITDEDLRQSFIEFGEVLSIKIPAGKGCGFVQFSDRSSAEDAIEKLNGAVIGKQTVRLSWGRTPANKWNGGYYGRQGQGHGGYAPSHHQNGNGNMYASAGSYGASSNGHENYQTPVS